MKFLAIVQARLTSKRLPKKVLKDINGIPLLELMLKRVSRSKKIKKIVVAIPFGRDNDELYDFIVRLGYDVFRGDENNVLKRYYDCASKYRAENIVRLTADCPLIDSQIIDNVINYSIDNQFDYCCNNYPPTYPDGMDVEVFNFNSLKYVYENATDTYDKEHVTPFFRASSKFKWGTYKYQKDLSHLRLTVDEREDLKTIINITAELNSIINFKFDDLIQIYNLKPHLFLSNINIKRNSGASMSSGVKVWERAKNVIPGANSLLSKRAEMFLPKKWPSYFSKTEGCYIWDLDNNRYLDMCIMGIGTNSLGYSNPFIDKAVMEVVKTGNMSTLNAYEEVQLAEKLVEINSDWAEMVKFARTGGEANSIAIRIARAASGKDGVAICGYHGWHDWYLSANLNKDNELDKHLLPGLSTIGVPKNLKNTSFTFNYNDINELENLINNHEIGVVKMEVMRNIEPKNNFLQKVRELCTNNNIVLIFDECTSGFREVFGGLHKKYNVNPDLCIYGKALGNGYAITSIVGKKSVMQFAQDSFISSTFWTERIGFAAGLATLEEMEKIKSWEVITQKGKEIKKIWEDISLNNKVDISQNGIPSLASFSFNHDDNLKFKTYITQEMLKKGILASNLFYSSTAHSSENFNCYANELNEVFHMISKFISGDKLVDSYLETDVCMSGFGRLN